MLLLYSHQDLGIKQVDCEITEESSPSVIPYEYVKFEVVRVKRIRKNKCSMDIVKTADNGVKITQKKVSMYYCVNISS